MIPITLITDQSCAGISLHGKFLAKSTESESKGNYLKCVYNPALVTENMLTDFLSLFTRPLAEQERFTKNKDTMQLFTTLLRMPNSSYRDLTEVCLLDELKDRNYDLKTLRVEVAVKGQPIPKRAGRQTPGRLRSLYSKDSDGQLDVICWWSVPGCSKRDVNMLFYYFSGPAYTGPDLPAWLPSIGFEPRSFLFQIDHSLKAKLKPGQLSPDDEA